MSEPQTIFLFQALQNNNVSGRNDVLSGLGKVYLASVDAWYPTYHELVLTVGKSYKFRDRYGAETDFVA